MTNPTRGKWLLTLIACAGISACFTQTREDMLQHTLLSYAQQIRWGSPLEAANFLDPDKPEIQPTQFQLSRSTNYAVTEYRELGGRKLADGSYSQNVEIRMTNKFSAVEKTLLDRQIWRFNEASETWLLTTGLPY